MFVADLLCRILLGRDLLVQFALVIDMYWVRIGQKSKAICEANIVICKGWFHFVPEESFPFEEVVSGNIQGFENELSKIVNVYAEVFVKH